MAEPKHKFDDDVEKKIADTILNEEFEKGKNNHQQELNDFLAIVDLFDAIRSEKDYEWMSDIFIPEFPTHMLTQSAMDVDQYFQTRDFVEVYVQDERQEALDAADSNKECINRTLNRRDLFHYQKYVRAKLINHLNGSVIAECWWEPDKDQFNYDVIHPANATMSSEYCYSLQQKEWIILRSAKSLHQLKYEKNRHGYFNLDVVEKLIKPDENPKSEKDAEDPSNPQQRAKNKVYEPFDIYKRFGKFWILPDGTPGVDDNGEPLPDARLEEMVITVASGANSRVLIGFHVQPYKDALGNRYRNLIRGLCYIHPTNDNGVGDGKYARELQIATNDTFNLGNDRTRLATMPTLGVKKYVMEDTDSIYMEPNHVMELEDPKNDIHEIQIQDNIAGAMQQIALLSGKMQAVTSIYPPDMGGLPDKTSVTATAVMQGQQSGNKRINYKSTTFDTTFMLELYWMISQMTWQFARPQTGEKLMGEKVYDFNPSLDYFYKPLSQSIDSEQNKSLKIQRWMQILQIVAGLQHPDAPKLFNYIVSRMCELMGDEYVNFALALLNPEEPLQPPPNTPEGGAGVEGASNQYGIGMGAGESMTREVANEPGLLG